MKHPNSPGVRAPRLLAAVLAVTFLMTQGSLAAPTDAEANKQIDSAINTQYASAQIAAAEKTLLDLIQACGNQCAPSTVARAWMYVGIVRGSGKDDLAGAQKAFAEAKRADANVKLDELFATELVKRVFQQTTPAAAARPDGMPLMGELQARAGAGTEAAASAISCTLSVTEIETQRPIPFACTAPAAARRVVLSYKHENAARWSELQMTQSGRYWTAIIPCAETKALGVLGYRVQAFDAQGQSVDELGSEAEPQEVNLVDETSQAPPALPDQAAPESCRPKKVEAPQGPILGGYGQACSNESQCQGGLACIDGICTADISCDSDSDCISGACIDGVCDVAGCEGDACEGRVPRNWLGVSGALDFAYMSGSGVCDPSESTFSCFEDGQTYEGRTNRNLSGEIDSGFQRATARVMLSYERVISSILTLEGRLGFAFNGGPESTGPAGDGSSFLPVHAEARAKIFFSKVFREDGRNIKGLGAFFVLGGGVAQIDPRVTVPVGECVPPPFRTTISEAENDCIESDSQAIATKELTVYKRLGQSFVTAGPGLRYGITRNIAANLQVMGLFLLPSTGIAITPSLGVAAGF